MSCTDYIRTREGVIMNCQIVKIKKLAESAKEPIRGSDAAAGYDLYLAADFPVQIAPHKTVKVSTGLSMEIPEGYWGAIFARSGLATKMGLRPANCTGVIDSDYRGPIIVAMHNDSDEPQCINPGERIAQFILMPQIEIAFEDSSTLSETERGSGGFGSTGSN